MILGLDIESSSIKAALIKKKGGYELIGWEIFEIPEGVIRGSSITDMDTFLKILMTIPSKFKIKNSQIAFSVSGPANTAIRIIEFPFLDTKEIDMNLPLELDKHIPFSVKEVYYDYYIIEKNKSKHSSLILIAVALKDIVNEYSKAIEKAGMTPLIADISSIAFYNLYEVNYAEQKLSAIVNIGENVVNFAIVKGKVPLYIRDSINSYKIAIEKASEEEMRNYADEIAAEIYRQIAYFKTLNPENVVEKFYITGLPTSSPNFLKSIEERLELPISLFNPFKNIKIHKDLTAKMQKYSAVSSVSIGLSLRGTEKIK